jgi:hypothetical protein
MQIILGSARSMRHRGEGDNHGKDCKTSPRRTKPSLASLISVEDAVKLIKAPRSAKFDETLEIAMNLGVDPRHADQMVRGVDPAERHRQDRPRRGVRPWRKADEARPPVRTSSVPKT